MNKEQNTKSKDLFLLLNSIKIEQLEDLLQRFLINSPMGLYIVKEREFVFVNPMFEKITNYYAEEILGTNCLKYVYYEDKGIVRKNAIKMLKGQHSSPYEYRFVNKEGQVKWVMETVISIRYHDNKASLGCFMDITERKKVEEKLKYLSTHDAITGLYNRTYFEEEMRRLESGRFDPVGIIVCDVDGLKQINDNLGHKAGDNVLIMVANIMRRCFRTSDVIARIGGDEFVILLPNCSSAIVEEACKRIKFMLSNQQIYAKYPISFSIGSAVKTSSQDKLGCAFIRADNKMYEEKAKNREKFNKFFKKFLDKYSC